MTKLILASAATLIAISCTGAIIDEFFGDNIEKLLEKPIGLFVRHHFNKKGLSNNK